MTIPTMGKRLTAAINRDRAYWTEDQLACFYAACAATGTAPGPITAGEWKRGRGTAAEFWRRLTGGERKEVKRQWRSGMDVGPWGGLIPTVGGGR